MALVLSTSVFWKETSLTLVNTQLQFPAESFHEEKEVSPCRWVRTNTSVSSLPFLTQWLFENFTALKPLPLLTPGIRVNFVHELSPSVIVPWNEPYHSTWMCISHCLLLTQENPIFLLHVSFHLCETSLPWSWLVRPWQSRGMWVHHQGRSCCAPAWLLHSSSLSFLGVPSSPIWTTAIPPWPWG